MSGLEYGRPCEQCDKDPPGTWYCDACDSVFCNECWLQQIAHKKGKRGPTGVAHEKADWAVAKRLEEILTPTADPIAQQRLHWDDVDTTWFGVARSGNSTSKLIDYGRYAKLMQMSWTGEFVERFPQIVSFIGQTGDGKSTLVRMLIDQHKTKLDDEFPTPVIGAPDSSAPTSGDVHLYADPKTYFKRCPRLYADSEGLQGGERTPLGDRNKVLQTKNTLSTDTDSRTKSVRKKWDIKWADDPSKKVRENTVGHLYPRFLYTFSNVVVFVLRNERTFEAAALSSLLDWASASIESSVNQPALPHAIIALNACDHLIPDSDWDVDISTKKLLDTIDESLSTNPAFSKQIQTWTQDGRVIKNTLDLINCYYSSFRVVRIPAKGRYALLERQIKKLDIEIERCCQESHVNRKKRRLDLDADELADCLQSGFAHFSQSLHRPFDFVEHSWNLNPIPSGFAGNILRLAIAIRDSDENATGPEIFFELSMMVASCIMLDCARHRIKGNSEALLRHYQPILDQVLKDFCNSWWPCNYQRQNKKCVNTYGRHTKGHQDANGKIFGEGKGYTSNFNFDSYRTTWHAKLGTSLEVLSKNTGRMSIQDTGPDEKTAAAKFHLEQMNAFYMKFYDASLNWYSMDRFLNNSACFCCLRELPQCPLPCGHVLCLPCVQAFGRRISETMWKLDRCPLKNESPWGWRLTIAIKPQYAGVRVLSLDGGGIRGVVELQILAAIERELGGLKLHNFLDMIVGTSTGGIIALGIGTKEWGVQSCLERFREVSESAFTSREFKGIPLMQQIAQIHHQSRYKTRPLESALQETFGEGYLFGGKYTGQRSPIKVALTSTTEAGQGPVVLANYHRSTAEHTSYRFERPERKEAELKTWEAARATAAALPYFKPFKNPRTHRVYLDGAFYHNNPVNVAESERKLLWPDVDHLPPDLFLSVGTGLDKVLQDQRMRQEARRREQMPRHSADTESLPETPRKFMGFKLPRLLRVLTDRVRNGTDAQEIWNQFYPQTRGDFDRYIRINPELRNLPSLDAVQDLDALEQQVREVLAYPTWKSKINEAADRLIASCFYFEKSPIPSPDSDVRGLIKCRFEDEPTKLFDLARKLNHLRLGSFQPFFKVIENYGTEYEKTRPIPLDDHVLNGMRNRAVFDLGDIEIVCPTHQALTMIELCFRKRTRHVPISGFPRQLIIEDDLYAQRERNRKTKLHSGESSPESAEFCEEEISELDSVQKERSSWSGFGSSRPVSKYSDKSRSLNEVAFESFHSAELFLRKDSDTQPGSIKYRTSPKLESTSSKAHEPESVGIWDDQTPSNDIEKLGAESELTPKRSSHTIREDPHVPELAQTDASCENVPQRSSSASQEIPRIPEPAPADVSFGDMMQSFNLPDIEPSSSGHNTTPDNTTHTHLVELEDTSLNMNSSFLLVNSRSSHSMGW